MVLAVNSTELREEVVIAAAEAGIARLKAERSARTKLRRWALGLGRTRGRYCIVDATTCLCVTDPMTLDEVTEWIEARRRRLRSPA